ncbi:MFS transporter [Carbonactinospora thermoautotrophica]|uniref:MFS transporter n=1 Tax=Carbonactinospora thermoautotrophica TaxID=1469144 RepID=UPI00226F73C0|nr:MFS transporter [Carbonactinospora thermoautotrophica]MCX9192717.1 MFS transporter [Carbonactinospora thermoautotrophica]
MRSPHATAPAENLPATPVNRLRQPLAVWATAFASVVAFMGIGLVDPILPAIATGLRATPSQVSLLFTSYFLITAVAMLGTGFVSSRIGGKWTLLTGLALVVVFAALSGLSGSVAELVGFRAGWGLGNAMFVATALAVIVSTARGGSNAAIMLYEAALGLGISVGPLVGAALGGLHWRYPFFGTSVLMAIGFVLVAILLRENPKPARKITLAEPLRALRHGGLATTAGTAFLYNYAFFTVLAFTPFVLHMDAHGIGLVFFGWGVAVAVSSVLLAPLLQRRHGTVTVMYGTLAAFTVLLLGLAAAPGRATLVALVVLCGLAIGVSNTVFTEAAMEVTDLPRPVASAGYNLVRWIGAALAPYVSGLLAEHLDPRAPFLVAAVCALLAVALLRLNRGHLHRVQPIPGRDAEELVLDR